MKAGILISLSAIALLTSCKALEEGNPVTSVGNPDCVAPCENSDVLSAADLVDSLNLKGVKGFALIQNNKADFRLNKLPASDVAVSEDKATNVKVDDVAESNVRTIDDVGDAQVVGFTKKRLKLRFAQIYTTPKAMIFALNSYGQGTCTAVVLRKDNGKLFCITTFSIREDGRERSKSIVQSSTDGNIVVVEGWDLIKNNGGGTSLLYRLNLDDPSKMVVETIYDKDGYPELWAVNGDGDALVRAALNEGREMRLMTATGGLLPFGDGESVRCLVNGAGAENKNFFYLGGSSHTPTLLQIKKTQVGGGEPSFDRSTRLTAASADVGFNWWGCDSLLSTESVLYFAMTIPDRDSGSAGDEDNYNGSAPVVAFDISGAGSVRKYMVAGMRNIDKIIKRDNTLVLFGREELGSGVVYELNLATGATREIIGPRKYIVSGISVVSRDKVRFYAERTSDGAYIQATVDIRTSKVDIGQIKLKDVQTIEALN